MVRAIADFRAALSSVSVWDYQAAVRGDSAMVVRAPQPMRRRRRCLAIRHTGHDLFAGLPSPMPEVRYHPLVADELLRRAGGAGAHGRGAW